MKKYISILYVLLASFSIAPVLAGDETPPPPVTVAPAAVAPIATTPVPAIPAVTAAPAIPPARPAAAPVSTCAEWKSNVNIDMESLNKLQKNVAGDKPDTGMLYTKKQFVVLLGKNWAKAKEVLASTSFKAKLPRTSEGKVDLRDVTLDGFNLAGLNFDNVDFKGSELNGADLSDSSLRGASLAKVELEGANLNNANLSFAYLYKSKFKNASLCHATLTSADLDGADLRGAYVKDAKFDTAKNIPPVIYLNSTSIFQFGLPVPPEN